MPTLATIDVLDIEFKQEDRPLRLASKPITPRADRLFVRCNPRRAHADCVGRHPKLKKHNGKPKREGSRFLGLERIITRDIEEINEPEPNGDDPWLVAKMSDATADPVDYELDRRREERKLLSEELRLQAGRRAREHRRLLKQIRRDRRRITRLEADGQIDREVRLRLVLIDLEIAAAV